MLGVDDEPLVLRSYERLFARAGAEFVPAQSVGEALTHLAAQPFDVVLTDIHMPGKSGLDLLREIRERGFDVPAILITGSPHVDTAVQAIEHGAVRYLSKPVDYHELVRVVGEVAGIYKLHRLRHAAHDHVRSWEEQAQQAELEQLFSRCLDRLWIAYQPIISLSERRVVAYEALCRSDETAMATPVTIIGAAEKLGRVHELSRRIRERALEKLPAMPSDCSLFLNLHPEDLDDSDLIDPFTATADCAERIVLEVTERRQLDDVVHLKERIAALKSLGYRIAVDDLGAGYAGLSSLAHLDPAVVKLDMSLVRGVDSQPIKQRLIRSMAELCADMGAAVIVEGVETPGERDALVDCRCDWMQGYLFGRPARELGEPRF